MRSLVFNYMPVYSSFLDGLEAHDSKTGVQIEDILELQHDTINQDTYPLFANVKLTADNQPLASVLDTEAFGEYGLTTNAVLESVAFDKDLFYDAVSYYSNKEMLRATTGGLRKVTISRDRPFHYYSKNFTQPRVKRGHPYTYCGMLFHLPQAGDNEQLFDTGDVTAIDHLKITLNCRFDDWNVAYAQETT